MRWFLLTILLLALILVPFFIWEAWFNTLGDRIARGEWSTWYAAAAIAALLASDTPIHTVSVPFQNPSSTPAAAETMLDGMGRTMSDASSAAMAAAAYHVDNSPRAMRSPSVLNQSSQMKNGTRI